jgi:C1A family cysteine protease
MAVYSSFYDIENTSTAVLSMPTIKDELVGGHAMTIVGYDLNKKLLLVRNSFGEDWGLDGYCWMPFEFVNDNVWDSWIFDIELISSKIIK